MLFDADSAVRSRIVFNDLLRLHMQSHAFLIVSFVIKQQLNTSIRISGLGYTASHDYTLLS